LRRDRDARGEECMEAAGTQEPMVRRLVWGFSCQAIVFGFSSQFFVRSGKGRSSSRRLRSGSRSARKGSRDRNASGAWRRAALASLVFRSLERLSPRRDDEQRDGLLVSKL